MHPNYFAITALRSLYLTLINENYISIEDAALFLDIKPVTLRKWIKDKSVPAHKIGKQWKFKRSELEEWVKSGKSAMEYILDRIAKELDVQFNTRKQLLLKTLYAYIANSSTLDDLDCFSMFGTNSFSLVWEKVCAEVMDNQLQKPIGGLRLPVPLAEQYRDIRHKKLIDLIDKPQWAGTAPSGEPFVKQAEDTLIPDLISIVNADGNYQFIIFDAKYYNIQLEHNKRLRGQPGIESITKQYLYQLAYQPFAEAHQINTVRNCFLMPTDSAEVVEKGTVSLSMLSNLGLQDIQVRLLPAETVYRHYLENTKMDIRILNL